MADLKAAYQKRILLQGTGRYILPALILSSFFILWETAAVLAETPLLPRFSACLGNIPLNSSLPGHMLYSLFRIAAGSLLAVLIGIPAGIAAGRRHGRPAGKGLISIVSYLLYPLPKTALIPVFFLAFGIGEFSKILLITFSLVFQIIISVRDSTASINESYYMSLSAAGGGRSEEIRYLIIPAVLPGLFSTLRITAGISVAVLFFSEYFGTTYGMGFFIMDSRVRINYMDLYSGILALTLISGLVFGFIKAAENMLCRWNKKKASSLPF